MAAMKRGARRVDTGLKLGYGWVPDLPDQRDILYGVVRKVLAKLPPSVDLRPHCSPVEDQGRRAWTGVGGRAQDLREVHGAPRIAAGQPVR